MHLKPFAHNSAGGETQSHSQANHKKAGAEHVPAVPGRPDPPAEGRRRISL